jgi:signal transduction histidine kinase
LWMGLIFYIGIATLIFFIALDGMNTGVQDSPIVDTSKTFMSQFTSDFKNSWDYGFLTIVISSMIGLLLLSYVLRGNPGLFFAFIIVIMLLGLFGAFLSNGFSESTSSGILNTASANFPVLTFVMSNLMGFVLVTVVLMTIVFFGKPGGDLA